MSVSKLLADTHVLFSAQMYLASHINNQYYGGVHYVWCAPVFDASILKREDRFYGIPPSSSPLAIYQKLLKDTSDPPDLHSSDIERIKKGLKRGASYKLKEGVIDELFYRRILEMIKSEQDVRMYRPIMYIIPKHLVESKLKLVPVNKSANPLSIEFQIENLHQSEFTTIEF